MCESRFLPECPDGTSALQLNSDGHMKTINYLYRNPLHFLDFLQFINRSPKGIPFSLPFRLDDLGDPLRHRH